MFACGQSSVDLIDTRQMNRYVIEHDGLERGFQCAPTVPLALFQINGGHNETVNAGRNDLFEGQNED